MKKKVAIIGGGTAGLFFAAFLDTDKYDATIYEKKATLGRKFLVAGDGGFNLTHSEELIALKSRYTPRAFLNNALNSFGNTDLRTWLGVIGIPTFVGSSGRVFPEIEIKPIEVLKSMQTHLQNKGVQIECNRTFSSWSPDGSLVFNSDMEVQADYIVFALGGASWKVTGSEGDWLDAFKDKGIGTVPFQASNCAYEVNWPKDFIQKYEGEPLKNISITVKNKKQKGEVVITKFGIEGNAIYGLSPEIREAFAPGKTAEVFIDFKPTLNADAIFTKLYQSKSNITTALKQNLKLSKAMVALLKVSLSKEEYTDLISLSNFIKKFSIKLVNTAPIDEAISTAGGIKLDAIDANFELKKYTGIYCIGEMLDWDAPTGGYLIQACASMGAYLADHVNKK